MLREVSVNTKRKFCDRDKNKDLPNVELLDKSLHPAGFDFRKVEQIVDKGEEILPGSTNLC